MSDTYIRKSRATSAIEGFALLIFLVIPLFLTQCSTNQSVAKPSVNAATSWATFKEQLLNDDRLPQKSITDGVGTMHYKQRAISPGDEREEYYDCWFFPSDVKTPFEKVVKADICVREPGHDYTFSGNVQFLQNHFFILGKHDASLILRVVGVKIEQVHVKGSAEAVEVSLPWDSHIN